MIFFYLDLPDFTSIPIYAEILENGHIGVSMTIDYSTLVYTLINDPYLSRAIYEEASKLHPGKRIFIDGLVSCGEIEILPDGDITIPELNCDGFRSLTHFESNFGFNTSIFDANAIAKKLSTNSFLKKFNYRFKTLSPNLLYATIERPKRNIVIKNNAWELVNFFVVLNKNNTVTIIVDASYFRALIPPSREKFKPTNNDYPQSLIQFSREVLEMLK